MFCQEFGIAIPVGARTGVEGISRVLADPSNAVPDLIRGTAKLVVEEIHVSKKGDRYQRMLLTHGARSALRASKVSNNAGCEICGVRRWARRSYTPIHACDEIDRPSWPTGFTPYRQTSIPLAAGA